MDRSYDVSINEEAVNHVVQNGCKQKNKILQVSYAQISQYKPKSHASFHIKRLEESQANSHNAKDYKRISLLDVHTNTRRIIVADYLNCVSERKIVIIATA